MNATTTPEGKPPPLHERSDVFDEITASWNGGNDLPIVQAEFRGALRSLNGTAIPGAHDALSTSVSTNAKLIELGNDPLVIKTVKWIGSEKERHTKLASDRVEGDIAGAHTFDGYGAVQSGMPDDKRAGEGAAGDIFDQAMAARRGAGSAEYPCPVFERLRSDDGRPSDSPTDH
ncbi:MAG: hypothetical protein AAB804_01135 [Patescibacteria group bacterium]